MTETTLMEALEKLALITKNGLDTLIQIQDNANGSVAKNLNGEAKLYFHRNDYKKADGFSESMQI